MPVFCSRTSSYPLPAHQGHGHFDNMDPLSIFGTCVCIGQLSSSIRDIARSVRGSKMDLQAVASELDSLTKALDVLQPAITSLPQMVDILVNCNDVVEQIRRLLRKHTKGNIITGIQWASTGKDEMASLRLSLESHKTSILALLGTVNFLVSTRIKADVKAQEAVHTLQHNRVVKELANIKALATHKGPLEPRVVASFTPSQLPRRKTHPSKEHQEKIQSNKQTVNVNEKVIGLDNQGKASPAASTGQTRLSTIDSGKITPVAFMNAARSEQDRKQQLRMSRMIGRGGQELQAKQYAKARDTYCKILKEIEHSGYRGTSKQGDEQIFDLQWSCGKAHLRKGDLDQAELMFEQTLHSVSERLGTNHRLAIQIGLDIADLKRKRKIWPDAIRFQTEALRAMESRGGNTHTLCCRERRSLARMYDRAGDIDTSEKYYKLAIACIFRASGHTHEMTIDSLVDLAQFFQKHGVYDDVAGSRRNTLRLRERLETVDEEQSVGGIVDILCLLTGALQSEGRLKEASSTSERAVILAAALSKPNVNHEHPFWVLVANHLYSKQCFRKAENIWRQLWTQLRDKYGPLDVDTVKAMEEVVLCLRRQDLLQGGKLLVDEARKTRSENNCYELKVIVALYRRPKKA
ncbi:WD40/YVTN repeat-like-containing domain protein [Venturia nashicola]|nr:WD40/YVTN repeat-like-containing domain protein [Venturia nashicola]